MDRVFARLAAGIAATVLLGGCASVPRDDGVTQSQALVDAHRSAPLAWSAPDADASAAFERDSIAKPLTADRAVQLAFIRSPRIQQEYARLGIARADVFDAGRLANPRFSYANLHPRKGDGGSQITRSLSFDFAGLLLLPSRKRLAQGEFERVQQKVAATLLELAADVETTWYEYVAARQVAAMRDAIAHAGEASAELAQRFHDAGNISALQLALDLAAATQARLDAVRSAAEETRARTNLAGLLGLGIKDAWQVPEQLAAPLTEDAARDALVADALAARLDVAAARRAVMLLEDAAHTTRRFRFLGKVEIGYERESETDGARLHGPTLALQLPIFNQGQGAVLRADAQLADARARLAALELSVRNDVALGLERLAATREIVARYRTALVPQREAVVARTQEEVNFMLKGVFELIRARQDEYDAYQEYLEAVRDYWVARVELRRAAGGRLPDDTSMPEPTIGVEEILNPPDAMQGMDHGAQGMQKMDHGAKPMSDETPAADGASEHAGHDMQKMDRDPKPQPGDAAPVEKDAAHAGHDMQGMEEPAPADTPPKDEEPQHDNHHEGEGP